MIADRAWVLELTGSEGERGSLLRKQCGMEGHRVGRFERFREFPDGNNRKSRSNPKKEKCVTNLVPSEVIEVKTNPRHLADCL